MNPGDTLGQYRILDKLGSGGMGEVYRARDTKLGREVAIKVLPAAFTDDAERRERFEREARAASALSHPNVATIYECGESEGRAFIAMELVEGQSLTARIAGQPLATRALVDLALQVADALEEAHARGITHRDIKPGNLMVTPRGRVKVLDFGLARLAPHDADGDASTLMATRAGTALGTVPYMSPEQALGREVDPRSDLFSLGAVLYEMATGRRAFDGGSASATTDLILHSQPMAIARLNYEAPAELERIIRKCLEKDRERRYQSARELVVDLGTLKRDLDSGSGSGALRTPAAAAPRRFAAWWLRAAAVLLVVAVIGFFALKQWRDSHTSSPAGRPIASLAVLPLANNTGDAGQEYFADGMTDALITELAKIKALKVRSRTSVMRFKKGDQALPEIARLLGVEGIVQGSVARSGGRVRVAATLIRAASEEQLWTQNFDREEADVLTLDSEIAQAIAGQVRAALSPEEASRSGQRRKVKPEAYDLVLQGMFLIKSGGGPDAFRRAIALFEKAVVRDPQSVEAHAGLANALQALAGFGFAPYWESYPKIRKEVDTAMALDSSYAPVHLAKGALLWAERDPRGAMASYHRAMELDPGDSAAVSNYAWYVFFLRGLKPGDDGEALKRKAIEMDPLAQLPRCNYKDWLYGQRRYAEAEAQARKILDLDPDWFWAWDQLWRIHVRQGRLIEAQEESRKAWAVVFGDAFKPPPNLSWEAYEKWQDHFLEGQPRSWVPGFLAANCARRGEKQKALGYLEEAAKGNDVFMSLLDWPDFDAIREDPRFQKIVEDRRLPVADFCRIPPGEGKR